MADKKISKREHFSNIKDFLADNGKEEWAEVMAHEIELLDRKTSTGNTKKNEEHETIKAQILDVIVGSMTCTEITKAVNGANGTDYTSNKVSAMLKKMVEDDKTVTKVMDKKTALFSAV